MLSLALANGEPGSSIGLHNGHADSDWKIQQVPLLTGVHCSPLIHPPPPPEPKPECYQINSDGEQKKISGEEKCGTPRQIALWLDPFKYGAIFSSVEDLRVATKTFRNSLTKTLSQRQCYPGNMFKSGGLVDYPRVDYFMLGCNFLFLRGGGEGWAIPPLQFVFLPGLFFFKVKGIHIYSIFLFSKFCHRL